MADKKQKKDKEVVSELEAQCRELQQQLVEQNRCVDVRLDQHVAMLGELQEFYRRRAEAEAEYSRSLDRIVKGIMARHKSEKAKREGWPGYSTYSLWQTLLSLTEQDKKEHGALADIYGVHMTRRFAELADDAQRIHKRCRDITVRLQQDLSNSVVKLKELMRDYFDYHTTSKLAEAKLKESEVQIAKAEKGTVRKARLKAIEKQAERRHLKYLEHRTKVMKARNDYLLALYETNAAINRYFVDDVSQLLDCQDIGYHQTMARAVRLHLSAGEHAVAAKQSGLKLLTKCLEDQSQRADKQRFLDSNSASFTMPRKFEFQPHKDDEAREVAGDSVTQGHLQERYTQLGVRLNEERLANNEEFKTLEAMDSSLISMVTVNDYNATDYFPDDSRPPKSPHEHMKKVSDRYQAEAYYFEKMENYLLRTNLITRLDAIYSALKTALDSDVQEFSRPMSQNLKPFKKRKLGRAPVPDKVKVFGGSIDEYVEVTGREIPLVVQSCIRAINLYGMHHQGVFRVSGAQQDILEFKSYFEKDEDPLAFGSSQKDINAVAGVLKLYFRELVEPLFPSALFDTLMDASKLQPVSQCVNQVRELLHTSLTRPVFVVMRYLFAFLNHLSKFKDENMMETYNLAICFGPTLLPIPAHRDQVQFQSNVNELVQTIIEHHEEIFPNDGGIVYEKQISDEDGDRELDEVVDVSDEEESVDDVDAGDAETVPGEAVAKFDYAGRSEKELSFHKGDVLQVAQHMSKDWWKGSLNGRTGLIPAGYVDVREASVTPTQPAAAAPVVAELSSTSSSKRKSIESLPVKSPPMLTVIGTPHQPLSTAHLDKSVSASQPNIRSSGSSPSQSPGSSPLLAPLSISTVFTPSSLVSSGGGSLSPVSHQAPPPPLSPADEWVKDIDSAMERVMSEIDSLSQQQSSRERLKSDTDSLLRAPRRPSADLFGQSDKPSPPSPSTSTGSDQPKPTSAPPTPEALLTRGIGEPILRTHRQAQVVELRKIDDPVPSPRHSSSGDDRRLSKSHTPDLVLDLPISRDPPSPHSSAASSSDSSPTMSTAEVFANASNSTIKKSAAAAVTRHSSLKLRPSIPAEFASSVKLTSFGAAGARSSPSARVAGDDVVASKPPVAHGGDVMTRSDDGSGAESPWRPALPQFGSELPPMQPSSAARKVPPQLKPKPSVRIKPQFAEVESPHNEKFH